MNIIIFKLTLEKDKRINRHGIFITGGEVFLDLKVKNGNFKLIGYKYKGWWLLSESMNYNSGGWGSGASKKYNDKYQNRDVAVLHRCRKAIEQLERYNEKSNQLLINGLKKVVVELETAGVIIKQSK